MKPGLVPVEDCFGWEMHSLGYVSTTTTTTTEEGGRLLFRFRCAGLRRRLDVQTARLVM
eukprot:UN04116